MTHRNRLHSLLWTGAVVLATALSLVLMLQVKAVNSEIAEREKAIIATKQQIAVLETEFQTRARQQQLVRWNEVDFGYVAPQASQFLDGRAQLAALGKPVRIIEAEPIRMAAAAQLPAEPDAGDAAPVRMASADSARAELQGDAGKIDAPIRLAQGPTMMRQLVAREIVKTPQAMAKTAVKSAVKAASAAPASFADRFDLDSVIAEGQR